MADVVDEAASLDLGRGQAREAMTAAAWLLESRLEPFKHQLAAEMEQTKGIAIKAFIRQTNAVAELEQRRQTEAMAEAARFVVEKEVALPLRQFAAALKTLIE